MCSAIIQSLLASTSLFDKLQNAVGAGGQATDRDGNTIKPYQSALDAYKSNSIRMTGQYFELRCWLIQSRARYCPISHQYCRAQPASVASVTAAQQQNSCIRRRQYSYKNLNFVFGAIEDTTKLVDKTKFVSTMPSLPYAMPTVVKCDANQQYTKANDTYVSKRHILCNSRWSRRRSPHRRALVIYLPTSPFHLAKPIDSIFSEDFIEPF